jgi:hypothetical protein
VAPAATQAAEPASDDAGAALAAATAVAAAPPKPGPTVLAKDLHAPTALALDRAAVYWVDELDGEVARIPKRGGVTMTVYSGTGGAFAPGSSIAVDETDVYWTSQIDKASSVTAEGGTAPSSTPRLAPVLYASLARQDKNGGKPTVVASSTTVAITCIILDETSMYWVHGPTIAKASKKGGPVQLLGGGQKGADCVAADAAHLYWSVGGTEANKFTDGAIVESTKAGSQARLLVKNLERPANVHVDDRNVYWQAGDKVFKASKDAGTPEQLAQASGPIADLAVDDTHVYFLTPSALVRVSKDGGPVDTLAENLATPTSVGVDAANVYFTTRGTDAAKWRDGTLQKLAKQ